MNWNTLGFDKIKIFFENAVKNGILNHAYLFSGQEMIGKRTFSLELIQLLSGQVNGAQNLNRLIIDPAGSDSGFTISIDGIRNLKIFLSLSPYDSKYKIAIINDAHLMTHEAQNALLKILEEPNHSSIIILITSNRELLLPTVVSRCQEIRFPSHQPAVVKKTFQNEKISSDYADYILKLTNGRIGLAKLLIQDNNFNDVKKDIEELDFLISADINTRLITAQKLTDEKNKANLQRRILYWILYLRAKASDPKSAKILKGLLSLHHKSTQPQLNLRLALESFFVSI